jgi:hypothetical protein
MSVSDSERIVLEVGIWRSGNSRQDGDWVVREMGRGVYRRGKDGRQCHP